MNMKKIAFIGAGRMGKPMIKNLLKLGFEVHVYARQILKVYDIISNGARFHSTISDCLKDCEVTITMLGIPKDVEEVYFMKDGVLDSARRDSYVIDMTTTSPSLSELLFNEGLKRGLHVLDAPVSGGVASAKNATLSIMVGGRENDFRDCLPLFRAMGTNVTYMGKPGNGQHAKLANQIMMAGALAGVCEAIVYARKQNLNMMNFLRAASTGSAGSKQLDVNAPKILDRDFTAGFAIKHCVKDLLLAIDEANQENLNLDVLVTVMSHFKKLESDGQGEMGTQSLIKYYGG